jgi:hypothetical protein
VVLAGCPVITGADVCRNRTCAGNFVCNPQSGVCEPPGMVTPTPCANDLDCSGSTSRCDVGSGTCVECVDNGDCAGGTCSASKVCERLPDACATVGAPVDLSGGAVSLSGDTSLARGDVALGCALPGSNARDLVYAFSVPSPRRLVAHARAVDGSGLLPVLALRAICESNLVADQLGCAQAGIGTAQTVLVVDPVLPGTVYLWVDGEAGTEGAFELLVSLEDTTAGESCAAPIYLPLSKPSLTINGDTSTKADDATGTCGGSGGNDALYAVQLSTPKRVSFEVTGQTAGFSPVLYLRSTCDDPAAARQLACVLGAGGTAKIDLPRLAAGTHYVWVDAQAGKSGGYSLKVETQDPVPPPTNDTCASAEVLTMPPGGVGVITRQSDTSLARSDALGCGATGNDVVYTFTTNTAVALELRVTPFSGSPLKPAVYLRGAAACTSEAGADQYGCSTASAAGGVAALQFPNLPAGSYSVFVDGAQGTAGPFELKLDFKAAAATPANDTCAAPSQVMIVGAPVTVMGSTWGATDQHSGCELPSGGYSPDVAYSLQITQRQSLGVELKAEPGSALKPVLTLRDPGTCSSVSPLDIMGCGWGDPQFTDRLLTTIPVIDPGTYPVWIEGDDGTQGAFSLKFSPGPPLETVPANDTCAGAIALQSGVTVTGDTRAASHDSIGTCGLPDGANGEDGNDVAYRMVLAAAQNVTITVTPDATEGQLFRPVVYVEGPGAASCLGGGANKSCQIAQTYGGAVTLSLSNLAAGTYYVWVDGAGLSGGKFNIRWQ